MAPELQLLPPTHRLLTQKMPPVHWGTAHQGGTVPYHPGPGPEIRFGPKATGQRIVVEAVQDAVEAMQKFLASGDGLGLAANQVGIARRIFVTGPGPEDVWINPEITDSHGMAPDLEGCLSLPGVFVLVERAEEIWVKVERLDGSVDHLYLRGMDARVVQHEIEHLDGITILDHSCVAPEDGFTREDRMRSELLAWIDQAGKAEPGDRAACRIRDWLANEEPSQLGVDLRKAREAMQIWLVEGCRGPAPADVVVAGIPIRMVGPVDDEAARNWAWGLGRSAPPGPELQARIDAADAAEEAADPDNPVRRRVKDWLAGDCKGDGPNLHFENEFLCEPPTEPPRVRSLTWPDDPKLGKSGGAETPLYGSPMAQELQAKQRAELQAAFECKPGVDGSKLPDGDCEIPFRPNRPGDAVDIGVEIARDDLEPDGVFGLVRGNTPEARSRVMKMVTERLADVLGPDNPSPEAVRHPGDCQAAMDSFGPQACCDGCPCTFAGDKCALCMNYVLPGGDRVTTMRVPVVDREDYDNARIGPFARGETPPGRITLGPEIGAGPSCSGECGTNGERPGPLGPQDCCGKCSCCGEDCSSRERVGGDAAVIGDKTAPGYRRSMGPEESAEWARASHDPSTDGGTALDQPNAAVDEAEKLAQAHRIIGGESTRREPRKPIDLTAPTADGGTAPDQSDAGCHGSCGSCGEPCDEEPGDGEPGDDE